MVEKTATSPLLRVESLSVNYGPIPALKGISLEVRAGEVVTVLGANGAGKTTLLRTISGLLRPRAGTIQYDGQDLTRLPPHAIAARGVVHVPEGRGILGRMTVLENLRMGAFTRRDREVDRDLDELTHRFPILAERRRQPAALLSGGQQQMLAIGRALMSAPKLLLVDEPSVGLAPILVSHTITTIKQLKERTGLTVLMAEQNFHQAIRIADRGYIIVHGEIVFEGDVQALEQNELVRSYYLGTG